MAEGFTLNSAFFQAIMLAKILTLNLLLSNT